MDGLQEAGIDCDEVVRNTKPRESGVFFRGPAHDHFEFFSHSQWRTMASNLLDPITLERVNETWEKRTTKETDDCRAFIFCWIQPGPISFAPMFLARVTHWVYAHPKRRSQRLRAKQAS